MPKFIFRSRWIAIVWAMGVLFSIGTFFSDGGGQEKLTQAASDIRAKQQATVNQAQVAQANVEVAEIEDAAEDGGFAGDEAIRPDPVRGAAIDPDSSEPDADSYVILDRSATIEQADESDLAPSEVP